MSDSPHPLFNIVEDFPHFFRINTSRSA